MVLDSDNREYDENTNQYFMEQAFKLAQQAEQNNEIPVGAVVVYQGKNYW